MASFTTQLRQASVIYGAGPGALTVLQDGSSVIIAGTDTWYIPQGGSAQNPSIPNAARLSDKRLSESLGVQGFVQPPVEGLDLDEFTKQLPASLFPKWVTCFTCNSLLKLAKHDAVVPKCAKCSSTKRRTHSMVQVNFVVACSNGHLGEFPWVEWVHKGSTCANENSELSLKSTGAAELKKQVVSCSCGKRRHLAGTQDFDVMRKMNHGGPESLCPGTRPWLHDSVSDCSQPYRMVQRNANNLYFAATESSILIPEKVGTLGEILGVMADSPQSDTYFTLLLQNEWDYNLVGRLIRLNETARYRDFSVEQVIGALKAIEPNTEMSDEVNEQKPFDRHPEYAALTEEREHPLLTVRSASSDGLGVYNIQKVFEVAKLNRTIALKGFSRLSSAQPTIGAGKSLLRRNPFSQNANWLPAVRHSGEGILIQFDVDALARWESIEAVQARAIVAASGNTHGLAHGQVVTPRFMLLHTFSHLMMQQLVQYSGYTSAALAERIYATPTSAGVLLFTAAGDADGTMGGLCELARSDVLNSLVGRAIEESEWCASDPMCSQFEHGKDLHKVPNLAACHNCVFVPETACDYSNAGLDRNFLTGGFGDHTAELGFFR